MTTKQRFRNNKYRLEVRERDHGPAHCHLVGGEVDVIIYFDTLATGGRSSSRVTSRHFDHGNGSRAFTFKLFRSG